MSASLIQKPAPVRWLAVHSPDIFIHVDRAPAAAVIACFSDCMRLVSVLMRVSRDRVRRVVTSRQGAREREGTGVLDTCFSVDDDDVNLRLFTPL